MSNTTDAADPSVLFPIINGAINACRKKDMKFVHIQLTINYAPLVNLAPAGATVLRAEYYIELPQTLCQMTDGNGNANNLLTFHGLDNIRTMTSADVRNPAFRHYLSG